jgi:hypothetical protein
VAGAAEVKLAMERTVAKTVDNEGNSIMIGLKVEESFAKRVEDVQCNESVRLRKSQSRRHSAEKIKGKRKRISNRKK